jgi:hypothetical protein
MPALFSDQWISLYRDAWNSDADLSGALAKIGFNSTIAYGFQGEDAPRCYIKVENGFVTASGPYTDQPLSWDLRATPADWDKWMSKGLGMMSLGIAYTTGKLKFKVGDYSAMVKNPAMAGPFIKSFTVMGKIPRD